MKSVKNNINLNLEAKCCIVAHKNVNKLTFGIFSSGCKKEVFDFFNFTRLKNIMIPPVKLRHGVSYEVFVAVPIETLIISFSK